MARFCPGCGLILPVDATSIFPGQVADPRALSVPSGFEPCAGAPDLFFAWESAFGGRALLGTEGIRIRVFNRGYSLANLQIRATGWADDESIVFDVQQAVDELGRGKMASVEIPSYELRSAASRVNLQLISAEFGSDE
jgi:hypothetical protein